MRTDAVNNINDEFSKSCEIFKMIDLYNRRKIVKLQSQRSKGFIYIVIKIDYLCIF